MYRPRRVVLTEAERRELQVIEHRPESHLFKGLLTRRGREPHRAEDGYPVLMPGGPEPRTFGVVSRAGNF